MDSPSYIVPSSSKRMDFIEYPNFNRENAKKSRIESHSVIAQSSLRTVAPPFMRRERQGETILGVKPFEFPLHAWRLLPAREGLICICPA